MLIFILAASGCDKVSVTYENAGKKIEKRVMKNNQRISVQYFNKDTVPDGPLIMYWPSGSVNAWAWYDKGKTDPRFVAYYNGNGLFDSAKGDPFITTMWNNGLHRVVLTVSPPNVKELLMYRDFYQDKIVNQHAYYCLKTDSFSIFPLLDHIPEKGHHYVLTYAIVDSVKTKILWDSDIELNNNYETYDSLKKAGR